MHKRFFSSVLLAIALIASLWMVNLTSVQASPLNAPKTPTPTITPTPISTVSPGNYYVSVSGSDANAGTFVAPWRHIQYALDRVSAGSTVHVLNGVYNEKVTFPRSGTSGNYIVLQNYAGHTPVIDGTGLPIVSETGLVVIQNRAYVKLIGFEIRNLQAGGSTSVFPAGIWIRGNGDHIEIRTNKVHNIENSCSHCGAHGIAVYGRDPNASIHDLIIDGNEVYDLQTGWSESMVLNGNVEQFVVSNNIVHDNDNIGIDFIGFEGENPNPAVDRARDGTVTGNLVYNINSFGNPAYGNERSAGGIYVDGGTRIVIERNKVHDSNLGVELGSEHAGKNTSFVTLRNNFLYNNTQTGIAVGGYDKRRGSTENCVIVNNTLYNNFTQRDWGGEIYIQFDTRNNIIKNNIIFAHDGRLFINNWSSVMTGNIIDRNLFFAVGGGSNGTWVWHNIYYTTFAAYQSASGNDGTSLIGLDPLLVNPTSGDLHINTGSPAINTGENLPSSQIGTVDIDGNARIIHGTVDLGADER